MSAAPARAAAVRTVLVGATGRMGVQILQALREFPAVELIGAVASERGAALGRDAAEHAGLPACGVPITAALPPLLSNAQLVLDFSAAAAAAATLAACASARVPLLIGTTGLPRELDAPLAAAAEVIPLLIAPNTSLGVNLLLELVQQAARALPRDYDIEIVEKHHRDKLDAPSGTALALGAAAAAGRGVSFPEHAIHARHGRELTRAPGGIGFAVVRGGDVIGEHDVCFLGEGERLVLSHVAGDRAVFARGALQAGQWLARRGPGRYAMRDVFRS